MKCPLCNAEIRHSRPDLAFHVMEAHMAPKDWPYGTDGAVYCVCGLPFWNAAIQRTMGRRIACSERFAEHVDPNGNVSTLPEAIAAHWLAEAVETSLE